MEYQRSAQFHADNLNSLSGKIDVVKNSIDFSDTEKEMQAKQIFQEADAALSDLNSTTITYQRYVKRFLNYYNDLHLTDVDLRVKS